jgi:hypothetical protein
MTTSNKKAALFLYLEASAAAQSEETTPKMFAAFKGDSTSKLGDLVINIAR